MTKTAKSNLSEVWTTGHPGVIASPNQSGVAATHHLILGSREGMGVGQVLPQVLDLARKAKR
ncbi:hypothetical protein [Massilia varians]|uniref:hypothetical protein n=1 Tax=Massilia varians TaxID=457921 RepID=UPI00255286BA|nr:hypothetical protein [Massilia varians]MDK6080569.1 hypothetical protein [Massilia varians]